MNLSGTAYARVLFLASCLHWMCRDDLLSLCSQSDICKYRSLTEDAVNTHHMDTYTKSNHYDDAGINIFLIVDVSCTETIVI